MQEFDAIVVGASVAGSSTAGLLGQAGHRVLLLDRASFPRPKVCGEGLMPAGVRLLGQIGLDAWRMPARPFTGIRFQLPGRVPLEWNFEETLPGSRGLVISRETLDSRLVRHAAGSPNVDFRPNFLVRQCERLDRGVLIRGGQPSQTFRCRVLVGADGIRSRVAATDSGIRRSPNHSKRFALRALFERYSHSEDWVEVDCAAHGEAYVAPLDFRSARVTLLLNGPLRFPNGLSKTDLFQRQLERFPRVWKRTGYAPPRRVESTSPVSRTLSRCHGERILLVGDAAGAVDPITGQGMTLALRDALLAAELLDRGLRGDRLSEADLRPYTIQRLGYFLGANELSKHLLTLLRHPWLVHRVQKTLVQNASLRKRLLAPALSLGPLPRLRWSDRLRLVAGF